MNVICIATIKRQEYQHDKNDVVHKQKNSKNAPNVRPKRYVKRKRTDKENIPHSIKRPLYIVMVVCLDS